MLRELSTLFANHTHAHTQIDMVIAFFQSIAKENVECWHKCCYLKHAIRSQSHFMYLYVAKHSYQHKSALLLCKYDAINFHKCDISFSHSATKKKKKISSSSSCRICGNRKSLLVMASKFWIIRISRYFFFI